MGRKMSGGGGASGGGSVIGADELAARRAQRSASLRELSPIVAQVLEEMVAGKYEFVIVSASAYENRYVQFTLQGDELVAEAVCNRFLKGAERLDDAARKRVMAMGWVSPHRRGARRVNYHRSWPMPADCGEVSQFAVQTLGEIYGARGVEDVNILRYGEVVEPATHWRR